MYKYFISYKYFSNDLEIVLTIIGISLLINIIILIIDTKFNLGKLYLNIFKMKLNIINNKNNTWLENKEITDITKNIELDFVLQIYNHKNTNNSIYNLDIYKKSKRKLVLIEHHNLNLTDSYKSISGSTTYEKIKYINLVPYEVKEYRLKIKLTKDEYSNLKTNPIYLVYKNRKKTKKLKLNKYLKDLK